MKVLKPKDVGLGNYWARQRKEKKKNEKDTKE
jgi:hypothetical protein